MSIMNQDDKIVSGCKELADQEMDRVNGGTGSENGYEYVSMFIQGNILKVRAGYDVRSIHVYRNDSQIRYTRTMTAGQVLDIELFGDAPMIFKVTGHACKDNEDFEYSLIG